MFASPSCNLAAQLHAYLHCLADVCVLDYLTADAWAAGYVATRTTLIVYLLVPLFQMMATPRVPVKKLLQSIRLKAWTISTERALTWELTRCNMQCKMVSDQSLAQLRAVNYRPPALCGVQHTLDN